jgi:Mg/Co/Ni transporter MgtE
VVDDKHRLVGVVTIDDILDYLLPDDWRSQDEDDPVKRAAPSDETGSIRVVNGRRGGSGTR